MTFTEIIAPLESARGRLLGELVTTLWKNPRRLFIGYRAATATDYGILYWFEEATTLPEGVQLATPEPVPVHLPREQIARWITKITTPLPLIPSKE